jgi:hypothetical protein
MDGYKTYVVHYQAADGDVFTDRILSNNPHFEELARGSREAAGYSLLSMQGVDGPVIEYHTAQRKLPAKWQRTCFRTLLVALLAIEAFDVTKTIDLERQIDGLVQFAEKRKIQTGLRDVPNPIEGKSIFGWSPS